MAGVPQSASAPVQQAFVVAAPLGALLPRAAGAAAVQAYAAGQVAMLAAPMGSAGMGAQAMNALMNDEPNRGKWTPEEVCGATVALAANARHCRLRPRT
jgi:hypothetical protein